MRRLKVIIMAILILGMSTSCEDVNLFIMGDAAGDAVRAVTLSDEDVKNLAHQAAITIDSKNKVATANSSYAKRLKRLTAGYQARDGKSFNFKVYMTPKINAFAMADGTIRVNSGLMDLMNDEELLFVIGHEMGHVVHNHSRKKVVMAYASSAVRKGIAAQENEIGLLARSVVGGLAERLTNAQFSQHEERQADIYGYRFLEKEGQDSHAAVTALEKLATLARQHTVLSSHPEPAARAKKLRESGAEEDEQESSLLKSLWNLCKTIVVGIFKLLGAILRWLFSLF